MYRFEQLLDTKVYEIPDNQRGYSWGRDAANAVFDDLALADPQNHYFGPIIVTQTDHHFRDDVSLNDTHTYLLEDGQQRLTTFFVILHCLWRHLRSLGGPKNDKAMTLQKLLYYNQAGQHLRLSNAVPALNQHLIFVITGKGAPPSPKTPPMTALEDVHSAVKERVSSLALQEATLWGTRIANKALFTFVDLNKANVSRYLTFDAINSRGLPLSEFDKIKNFCMLACQQRSLKKPDPAKEWYAAITHLEAFGVGNRSHEDAFIADAYAASFGKRPALGAVHAEVVNRFERLLTAADAKLESDLLRFMKSWKDLAKSYSFIAAKQSIRTSHYGPKKLCSRAAGDWLDRLDHLDLSGITRIILTVAHCNWKNNEFEQVAELCEKFTFRVYSVFNTRKDKRSGEIAALAQGIFTHGLKYDDVAKQVCVWLQEDAPLERVIQQLSNGEPKYAYDKKIRGWSDCYYFLYEYELHLSPGTARPLPWEETDMGRLKTQEHILPQSHRDGGFWQRHWPDEADAERYKHRLGNLTLSSNNIALGRKSLADKMKDPSGGYSYSHRKATASEKDIRRFTNKQKDWLAVNILKREHAMMLFAAERWSVPCCSDNGTICLAKEFVEADAGLRPITIENDECIGGRDEDAAGPAASHSGNT